MSGPTSSTTTESPVVTVFGGSGYVGRRVCQGLIQEGCRVVSFSRSGRPSCVCGDWVDAVQWERANVLDDDDNNIANWATKIPADTTAVVSLVGNMRPAPEWRSFFGLGFDDDMLRRENGLATENIIKAVQDRVRIDADPDTASSSSSLLYFVMIGVSYETAKALEGPLEGYLDGKRHAEHTAAQAFGLDRTIVLGPTWMYGGRRFAKLGPLYRAVINSPPAKAYTNGNNLLRGLSTAPVRDWVEDAIFSPPVDVSTVASVICAAALGNVNKDMVGPRRQGFFDTNGQPVLYDDVVFIDGTEALESVAEQVVGPGGLQDCEYEMPSDYSVNGKKEPPLEGALIGCGGYLRPIPVVLFFAVTFYTVTVGSL